MFDFDGWRFLLAVAIGAFGGWVMGFRFVIGRYNEAFARTAYEFRKWHNENLTELYRSRAWKRRWKGLAKRYRTRYETLHNSLAIPGDRPRGHHP